ncbi:MAG: hypothetical protein ABIW79_02760, partial [Gemmatimonas sp.]
ARGPTSRRTRDIPAASAVVNGMRLGDAFAVSRSQSRPASSITRQTPTVQSYSPTAAVRRCAGADGTGPGSSARADESGALAIDRERDDPTPDVEAAHDPSAEQAAASSQVTA